jgi:hypothetical protein
MDAFMKQAEKKEKEELRTKLQQLLDNSNMSKVIYIQAHAQVVTVIHKSADNVQAAAAPEMKVA